MVAVEAPEVVVDPGDDLHVDRIALRVAHLSLYRDGDRLWADTTRVRYLGEDAGSRIDMSGKAPEEAAKEPNPLFDAVHKVLLASIGAVALDLTSKPPGTIEWE